MPGLPGPKLVTELPGPKARAVLEESRAFEPHCMSDQQPLVWDSAEDVWITDVDGNVFLDFSSGVLVTNIGHCHPRYVEAIREQAGKLYNCYDFPSAPRTRLARKLVEMSAPQFAKAFVVTTGSEAVEAAIKMTRRATGRYELLGFGGAFHGRTYGAMSVGGNESVRKGFGPVMPGVIRAPYPYCYRCPLGHEPEGCSMACIDHLDYAVKTQGAGQLGAVITESYQGGAGSIIPPPGWYERLEEWRRDRGLALIFDEVQSSFGRTGAMFAYEHWGIEPDAVTLGKGLSSGVPCAAVLVTEQLVSGLSPGELSSTAGGNPLSSAAALASIDIIESENLVQNAAARGPEMAEGLHAMVATSPRLGDVRGMGLVWGLEMVEDRASKTPCPAAATRVVAEAFRRGLALIAPIGLYGNVVRIAPPLTITREALAVGIEVLAEAVSMA
ncbi:MAG: aspartate aminotransferase family protein [Armatimonadetes bacterium]|jgi:4-aminobutyrate aminotransferase|nr:aspartate aminotransferase family protein [Armatimonadota bacterium]MDI9602475.1 aspartate aminotransferase family protein [Acidobacteriota bacterium]NLN88587.1 aspartate aminotransferase family protein [candidate division WS1 bacterium]